MPSQHNQLRLGRFAHTTALILYRHAVRWRGDSHLSVLVTRGLHIKKITRTRDDTFELVYSYRDAHEVEVILEPPPNARDHAQFWRWEAGGTARQYYDPISGVTDRLAFLYASGKTLGTDNQRKPYIGVGDHVDVGHPFVVEFRHMRTYVVQALTNLGVVSDLRVISNRIMAEVDKQERAAGF